MAAAARPRRARPNPLFGLVRPSTPARGRDRSRARPPSRRELAEQVRNARARADRAIRRLERAGTEYEIEQAIRLGRHALRHLESVEGKAYAGGVDEPGRGLFGAFRRGGAPDAGLARLLEQAQDRLAVRREYERRGRRRALDVASGRVAAAPRAARGRHEAKTREFAPVSEREYRELEERERQGGKERAKKDEHAALRRSHTGKKTPRQRPERAPELEPGEDPAAALGFNPPRRRAAKGARRARRR